MPRDKRSHGSYARRPKGTTAPPAQMRRRQKAREAAESETSAPSPLRKTVTNVSGPSQLSRDRMLGYGAAAGALLGLMGFNIASLIIVVALGYVATALLGPAEKRDRRLRQAGWITGAMAFLMAVMVVIVLGAEALHPPENDVSLFAYLPMGGATLILATASTLALVLAAILGAMAFNREGTARYLTLSRAAFCALFYFVFSLPATVVGTSGPRSVGAFWSAPFEYTVALLNIIATAAVAFAFLRNAESSRSDGVTDKALRFVRTQRDYLLLVAAILLATAQVLSLLSFDWSLLRASSEASMSDLFTARAAYVARRLLPLTLSVFAATAFWISCRQAGWTPKRWQHKTSAEQGPDDRAQVSSETSAKPEQLSLSWAATFFLTWRLRLLYGWLIALVVACSFLSWYGFLVALPVAAHYLWMILQTRKTAANAS